MSYFRAFPYVNYEFPSGVIKRYKNLSLRPAIVEELLKSPSNLETYSIQEGDTPEIIAFDKYGDVSMHWVIMLCNDILNIYNDWPMTTEVMEAYLLDKYRVQKDLDGVERTLTDTQIGEFVDFVGLPDDYYTSEINLHDSDNSPKVRLRPHHFIDADGYEYSLDTLGATTDAKGRYFDLPTLTPISHYDYEFSLNEAGRNIYVPYSKVAQRIKRELRELLNE